MARPTKATKTLAGNAKNDKKAVRQEVETVLKGSNDSIIAPGWLSDEQRSIFDMVVTELAASDILGNLDIYVLAAFAVATERVFYIEQAINALPDGNRMNKDLIYARNSYIKDFWRGANELSLSPQARAKIGNINYIKMENEKDPVLKLLAGKK